MADTPVYRLPVDPPPPPSAMRAISLVLSLIAAVLGFLGYGLYAGVAAAGSFIFGLADFLINRGFVEIPGSAMDSEGRLKGFKAKPGA